MDDNAKAALLHDNGTGCQDLRVLELLTFQIIEKSPHANIVVDRDGAIVIFNYQAELMFGYSREEVIGKQLEFLLPDEVADAHKIHRANYFIQPRVRDMGNGQILRGKNRHGSFFPVEIMLAPVGPIPGAGVFALAVIKLAKEASVAT